MSPYNGFNHAMKNWIHGNNRGMKGLSHKFNSSLKGMIGKFNSGLGAIGHKVDHAVKSNEASLYALFKASGMTEEEMAWMYAALRFQNRNTGSAYFSHRYTGHKGNRDPFHGYYIKRNNFLITMVAISMILNEFLNLNITSEKLAWVALMIPFLSPAPVSFADSLAVRHDREWPQNNWDFKGIFDANNHYITGWVKGIGSKAFWQKPVDSVILGGGGTALFIGMNYGLVGLLFL